jgi:hypothetical protein
VGRVKASVRAKAGSRRGMARDGRAEKLKG